MHRDVVLWAQEREMSRVLPPRACALADGAGIEYGPGAPLAVFDRGRHVRANSPNISVVSGDRGEEDVWVYGRPTRGEGIYECANEGTCIAPDVCTCKDGWSGFDCNTPLCRHLQFPSRDIASCENGGVCVLGEECVCSSNYAANGCDRTSARQGMYGVDEQCTVTLPPSRPMTVEAFGVDGPGSPLAEGANPADVLLALRMLFLPESPRYHLLRQRPQRALRMPLAAQGVPTTHTPRTPLLSKACPTCRCKHAASSRALPRQAIPSRPAISNIRHGCSCGLMRADGVPAG